MQFPADHNWLDLETRSLLNKVPYRPETSVDCRGYSLLLLRAGPDTSRIVQAVADIQRLGSKNSTNIPIVIAQQLTIDEAMAGQFSLCCCDCISGFVDDNLVHNDDETLADDVTSIVVNCEEFSLVSLRVNHVPPTEAGRRFAWQFLGCAIGVSTPLDLTVYYKKARLMSHWAPRCGVDIIGNA
jgi:hypothetical protein